MNITSHFQKYGGDSKLIKMTRPPVISIHTCTQTSIFRDTERVMLIFRWTNRFKTSGKYSVKYPRGQGLDGDGHKIQFLSSTHKHAKNKKWS